MLSHPCPRPEIERVQSPPAPFLNHGCLVQSNFDTSRFFSIRVGTEVRGDIFPGVTHGKGHITNFSQDTFLDDCAFFLYTDLQRNISVAVSPSERIFTPFAFAPPLGKLGTVHFPRFIKRRYW